VYVLFKIEHFFPVFLNGTKCVAGIAPFSPSPCQIAVVHRVKNSPIAAVILYSTLHQSFKVGERLHYVHMTFSSVMYRTHINYLLQGFGSVVVLILILIQNLKA